MVPTDFFELKNNQRLQEKCGVIGVQGADRQPIDILAFERGMSELQGRGEDCAGVAGIDTANQPVRYTVSGKIPELFGGDLRPSLSQCFALIGHNRYATFSGLSADNNQPFLAQAGKRSLSLAHNGNLLDHSIAYLRRNVKQHRALGSSDSALLTSYLLQERTNYHSWMETFTYVLAKIEGAYSLAMITEDGTLYAVRDPWGIRPLALGRKGQSYIVASETVSFDAMGADYLRELKPGELFCAAPTGQTTSIQFAAHQYPEMKCVLEKIYFSQPESYDGHNTIGNDRLSLGRGVAKRFQKKGIKNVDFVVPILGSGRFFAQGFAQALNVPLIEAIQKNDGSGRSFIQNNQEKREQTVHEKHVFFPKSWHARRVVFVDDSLIRGTSFATLLQRIRLLQEKPPREIHIVLGSPPVINTCDLGVAISTREELLVNQWRKLPLAEIERKVAEFLGVTSVTFSTLRILEKQLDVKKNQLCAHCFGGVHPVKDTNKPVFRALVQPALKRQKILFMASGSGSNVQALLEAMKSGEILAKPMGILCNIPQAGVIERGLRFKVKTTVVDSKGKLKDPDLRSGYFARLLDVILKQKVGLPDVIVLAGWNLILPDAFLQALIKAGIAIVNLHPALLSGKGQEFVRTSQGLVPEIRGAHGIEQTFAKDLNEMPIAGVTVHLVFPGGEVDTGEILLKQEVARSETQTLEELTTRMHETEHQLLPFAVQKVLLSRLLPLTQKGRKHA